MKTYIQGDAIEVRTVLDETPTTITVSIYNSDCEVIVSDQSLSQESGLIYTATIQTTELWETGDYYAIVTATIGGYATKSKLLFKIRSKCQ